jgi:hypothetical protein
MFFKDVLLYVIPGPKVTSASVISALQVCAPTMLLIPIAGNYVQDTGVSSNGNSEHSTLCFQK